MDDFHYEEQHITIEDLVYAIGQGLTRKDYGIHEIKINGKSTDYHAGFWMLNEANKKSISTTIDELNSWHAGNHNVTVLLRTK